MKLEKIGCVLVLEGENLVGIFTERDVLKKLSPTASNLLSTRVGSQMTQNPQTLSYTASIAKAMYLMHVGGFRHIPIKTNAGSWSMISVTDFMRFIYQKVSARAELLERDKNFVINPNVVDLFFEGNLSALKPSAPILLDPETQCEEVVKTMALKGVGSIVLGDVKSKTVHGIFTERDIVTRYIAQKALYANKPISEIMTPAPSTLQPSISVLYALETITAKNFRHIPVVDNHEKLIGVLSVKDFLSFISNGIVEELSKAHKA